MRRPTSEAETDVIGGASGAGLKRVQPIGHRPDPTLIEGWCHILFADPSLRAVGSPVEGEVVLELGEVVGDGVEGGAVAGSAQGDVGEFSAAAGGKDVGAVVGGALGSVDGDGVAVVEVLGVDLRPGEEHSAAVGGSGFEGVLFWVGAGDGEALAGDEALVRERGEDDGLVSGGVGPSSGGDEVRSRETSRLVHVVAGEAVEVPDVVPAPGQQGGVVPVVDVSRPLLDHPDQRFGAVRAQGCATAGEIPVDRFVDVAVAELAQGPAFSGVVLADVAVEGGEDGGMALEERSQRAAGPDGGELPGVADEDELRPGGLGVGDDLVEVSVGGHGGLVEDHDRPRVEGDLLMLQAPQERGDGARLDVGLVAQVASGLA